MTAGKMRLDAQRALLELEPGLAPCGRSQADGVPCPELGTDCADCPEGRDGLFTLMQESYKLRIKRLCI